ncbi:MAG: NYN domain-containing protein [Candidatus Dormibacteria bacterium]
MGIAESQGFEVKVFDRNLCSDKEKEVDSSIAVDMIDDSYALAQPGDEFTLVVGDRDHAPAVRKLVQRAFSVYVVFWSHGTARVLREAASRFVPLDDQIDYLARL